jgi:hypothetical protein
MRCDFVIVWPIVEIMNALIVLLVVIPGIIAALICFPGLRWLTVAALTMWFFATVAHAESSPIVQCRIGSFVQMMPDYACEALEAGAEKLHPDQSVPVNSGVRECSAEMTQYLDVRPDQMINVCISVWVAMRQDAATRRYHQQTGR